MPGKANKHLAASVPEGDTLVFPWTRRHPGIFWLWGFLVLSLLLHIAGFYLFQVVYPSSGRLEPFPAQVLILDKKNAANSVLLQELDDRLVFLQPASTESESRRGVDDFTVSFQPSFADHSPPFREPVTPGGMRQSTVASGSRPAGGKTAPQRHWSLAGALSERLVPTPQAEGLDNALASVAAGQGLVLDIVVSASGEVVQVTVNSGAGHPASDEIVAIVKRQLKFEPIAGNHSTKGELRIH